MDWNNDKSDSKKLQSKNNNNDIFIENTNNEGILINEEIVNDTPINYSFNDDDESETHNKPHHHSHKHQKHHNNDLDDDNNNNSAERSTLRVLFIHGLESSPYGRKSRFLSRHFISITPQMKPLNYMACLSKQIRAIQTFRPDVIVGSSFGGAVALHLLQLGIWKGPTVSANTIQSKNNKF